MFGRNPRIPELAATAGIAGAPTIGARDATSTTGPATTTPVTTAAAKTTTDPARLVSIPAPSSRDRRRRP